MGLPTAQGLFLTEAFYWDQNDGTRAFAKRFGEKMGGRMPTSVQAGYYSATKAYLDAVKAAGTDDADKVMAQMKANPTDDPLFGQGSVRADGRKMHNVYLFQVKAPNESKGRGITTTQSARFPARRPSVRWTKASAPSSRRARPGTAHSIRALGLKRRRRPPGPSPKPCLSRAAENRVARTGPV